MGVIIKDMEMPENCAKCKLGEYEDMEWFSCPFLEDSYRHNAEFGRLDECPIVAYIPDRHGRLIDADELKKTFDIVPTGRITRASVRTTINHVATIVEAE